MQAPDPKRDFALEVVRRLQQAGYKALWAGGCVRDMLLGHTPGDYDVATDARPDQVRALFGERRTLAIGAAFGVILVRGPRRGNCGDVEVATFRTEGAYLDGRRPQNVVFATAEEDARRRDFTINGLFFDPVAGRLDDYVGGRQDLELGIVRAIGNPFERFSEDKLRMLRAVRICARFAFQIEQATAEAARAMAGRILEVSQERIAQELRKMLLDAHRAQAVALAHSLGLLAPILPELVPVLEGPAWAEKQAVLAALREPGFELAMAALLAVPGDETDPISEGRLARGACRRLRLSNAETERIAWLVAQRHLMARAPELPVAQLKRLLAEPGIQDLVALHRATCAAGQVPAAPAEFCEQYLAGHAREELSPKPMITGDDLLRAGFKPGPHFKQLLDAIYDAQLEGRLGTREQALAHVAHLAAQRPAP